MAVYEPGDFVWASYNGEWFEAEIEEMESEEGVYKVFYEEYEDSVSGTHLYEIKDWKEGDTEPPPDGPNQANAPKYDEEDWDGDVDYAEEEELIAVVDNGGAHLKKRIEKGDKINKTEMKKPIISRPPTKAKDSKLFDAAKEVELRKSQKREELEAQFSFTPMMLTRGVSFNPDMKSSNRTSALYQHGKSKQQAELRRSYSVQEKEVIPKTKKTKDDGNGTGDDRINRLYQEGKEKEMRKLQKEDAEKQLEQLAVINNSVSYDARLGFDKSVTTGLGQDLVTTGVRSNALYYDSQLRASKKEQTRIEEEKKDLGSFQPKIFTRKSSSTSRTTMDENDVSTRLYLDSVARAKKLEKKKLEKEQEQEVHSYAPNISKSQRNCESSSLPRPRHEALFMKGEEQRIKKDSMMGNYVDGKEVDDLTFTPAVNYRYNDELLAHDTTDFADRLYRTNFAGSKQREEENADYQDHQYDKCTFAPELVSKRGKEDDGHGTGESRIDKLYKDAERTSKKKEVRVAEFQRKESSRKLTLATVKKNDGDEFDEESKQWVVGKLEKKAGQEKGLKKKKKKSQRLDKKMSQAAIIVEKEQQQEQEIYEEEEEEMIFEQTDLPPLCCLFSAIAQSEITSAYGPEVVGMVDDAAAADLKTDGNVAAITREFFLAADENGNGMINRAELSLAMSVLGLTPNEDEMEGLFRLYDADEVNVSEFDQFIRDQLCCKLKECLVEVRLRREHKEKGIEVEIATHQQHLQALQTQLQLALRMKEYDIAFELEDNVQHVQNELASFKRQGVRSDDEDVYTELLYMKDEALKLVEDLRRAANNELSLFEFDQFIRDQLCFKFEDCLLEVKERRKDREGDQGGSGGVKIATHLQHLQALQTQLQLMVRMKKYDVAFELEQNVQHIQNEVSLSKRRQMEANGMDEDDICFELLCMEEVLQYSADMRRALVNMADIHAALLMALEPLLEDDEDEQEGDGSDMEIGG